MGIKITFPVTLFANADSTDLRKLSRALQHAVERRFRQTLDRNSGPPKIAMLIGQEKWDRDDGTAR